MTLREQVHRLVDELPQRELHAARRNLVYLGRVGAGGQPKPCPKSKVQSPRPAASLTLDLGPWTLDSAAAVRFEYLDDTGTIRVPRVLPRGRAYRD